MRAEFRRVDDSVTLRTILPIERDKADLPEIVLADGHYYRLTDNPSPIIIYKECGLITKAIKQQAVTIETEEIKLDL